MKLQFFADTGIQFFGDINLSEKKGDLSIKEEITATLPMGKISRREAYSLLRTNGSLFLLMVIGTSLGYGFRRKIFM